MSKLRTIFSITLMVPAIAYASSIFNTDTPSAASNVQRPQQSPQVAAQGYSQAQVQQQPMVPAYRPTTPPAASVAPVSNADPKVMAQFERYTNESDDAYIARMKGVYQRSVADMERVGREHQERMRALLPPNLPK